MPQSRKLKNIFSRSRNVFPLSSIGWTEDRAIEEHSLGWAEVVQPHVILCGSVPAGCLSVCLVQWRVETKEAFEAQQE